MKKVAVMIFIVLGLIALAGCRTGERQVLPRGVWQSEYPRIILYIDDFYRHFASASYLGFVEVDGEMVRVFTSGLVRIDNDLSITRIPTLDEDGGLLQGERLFWSEWVFVDDQIHYEIYHNGQMMTAIFNRVYDYEPIDPKYWFPQHKHIFGVWESVYPEIVMYIETSYRLFGTARHFPGVFVLDDEEVEVVIYVDRNRIGIHDASYFVLGELQTSASSLIIIGHHEVEDDILRLRLSPSFGSRRYEFSGEIIFDRITERELINPSNQQ